MIAKAAIAATTVLVALALAVGVDSRSQTAEDAAFANDAAAWSAKSAEAARQVEAANAELEASGGHDCPEDEACWTGSPKDDRRGAELSEAFALTGWQYSARIDEWTDCWTLPGEVSVVRCLNGSDRVTVFEVS
jgi:hypothetical protein